MDKALYDRINSAIENRKDWAARQETFYRMRNGGIRRRSKPYPGAPDLHFPLGDSLIEKLKPMYVQQLYGGETIASFTSLKAQDSDLTTAADYWYDYNLKQRSNFERTMYVAIDEMLQDGFCIVKVRWDDSCKRLSFEKVDPLHLIVPEATEEINAGGGADLVVHILHMSEPQYRANKYYKQDDDYIKSIKGKGSDDDSGKDQAIQYREGINCSSKDNEIVLWEIFNRDRKTKRITIETVSPLRPCEDDQGPVREPFVQPYNKGIFRNGETFPFFKVRAELKSEDHYSSRGIIEINAPFEMSLTKTWNTQHEWMDYVGQPTYSSTKPVPNANNFRPRPGKILPEGLTPNPPNPPPAFLREDMEFTRALAEYRTQMPDLGASQHLTDRGGGGKVTATQINAIIGQSGQGNDMRARVFRLDVAEGLTMGWSILLQYAVNAVDEEGNPDTSSLSYIIDSEIKTIDQSALHEDYEIVPNGSADSWNKGAEFQKFMALYQVLQGNPYIGQDEATKLLLEKVDPRLVKRLYRDPGLQQQDQAEQQAMECLLMEKGWPAVVNPPDDDKTHIQTLSGFVERKLALNEPISAEQARLFLQHGGNHLQALEQKKDPLAKQIEQQTKPIAMLLGHIAQSDQPGNVIPLQAQGAGQPQPSAPTAGQPPPPATPQDESDRVSDATKVGNMLATWIKAGVPVDPAALNKVLVELNLPPIQPPQRPPQAQLI